MNFAIAVDFDGTIVEHRYPGIGKAVPGAFKWMKKFQKAGAQLILYTMRSQRTLERVRNNRLEKVNLHSELTDAIIFCRLNGVFFEGHNRNPLQGWTDSPKCYAQVYIDDAGICVPLIDVPGERPYVDWEKVGPAVMEKIKAHKERNRLFERSLKDTLEDGLHKASDKAPGKKRPRKTSPGKRPKSKRGGKRRGAGSRGR